MASTVTIPIPPGPNLVPLTPLQPFVFKASIPCRICFSVNALFPKLSGNTFNVTTSLGPYTAPASTTQINYSVVAPAQQCTVNIKLATPKVIHVGSSPIRIKRSKKKATKKKAPSKKVPKKKKVAKKKARKKR